MIDGTEPFATTKGRTKQRSVPIGRILYNDPQGPEVYREENTRISGLLGAVLSPQGANQRASFG